MSVMEKAQGIEGVGPVALKSGSTVVVKLGGATLAGDTQDGGGALLREVADLMRAGVRIVLVHGGGALITSWLDRVGVPTTFFDGVRVTDEPALEVATMVLRGIVNTGIVAGLSRLGVEAAGLSGVDNGLLRARRRPELGFVGEVERVDVAALRALLDRGIVPVIAPLGLDGDGTLLSINADTAAAAIAAALQADAALFLTDVPGVRGAGGEVIQALDETAIADLIAQGTIAGGMIPKVRACLAALDGASSAAILDGRAAGSLSSLLAGQVKGTAVAPHPSPSSPSKGEELGASGIAEREARAYMHTFTRAPLVLVRGAGTRVWDDAGRRYLDLVAGIAVNILGHAHPDVVAAIEGQARTLMHVSNLYYTLPQVELAELLVTATGMDGVFFTNSGAESNEVAIKIARKWGKRHKDGAYEIVCAHNSFHGRTLATVAATGKARYQEPFTPMPEGFIHIPYNDVAALDAAIGPRTAAVLLEPIQGESGIHPAEPGYLAAARRLCDERNALLMLDEVQSGMGRTGTFLASQGEPSGEDGAAVGVVPDVVTLAKGLGGGVPIGAALARGTANILEPGDHGSTLGGNPLASAAGVATMRVLQGENLPAHAAEVGAYLAGKLRGLKERGLPVTEVRGRGLMLAVEVAGDAAAIVGRLRERGVLVNNTGPSTLRMVPPLILTPAEADEAVAALAEALA